MNAAWSHMEPDIIPYLNNQKSKGLKTISFGSSSAHGDGGQLFLKYQKEGVVFG